MTSQKICYSLLLFPMSVQTYRQKASLPTHQEEAVSTFKDVGKALKHVGQFRPAVQTTKGKAHAMF